MTPREVEEVLDLPSFYLGDPEFRWSWYQDSLTVGFARSSAKELQAVWILQSRGSLEEKLRIGAPQADAERLYGRASSIEGLPEPRIRLKAEEGATLDIVLDDGRVSAFFLFLPEGIDPDIRLAGTGPGELPTFELDHPGSIDICPTTPGTTWVYSEDLAGNGFCSTVYRTVKDTWSDGRTRTVVYRREVPDWEELRETQVIITGDVCFYEGRPFEPARLYAGLEWSSAVVDRNIVIGTESLEIAAGRFPEALAVDLMGHMEYYVDEIGLVKRAGLELVEFHPGPK